MGADVKNQDKPLTKEERLEHKGALKKFYELVFPEIISSLNNKKLHPLFGIETEYHGVNKNYEAIPGAGKAVKEKYPEVHEDCGSQMLELNSSPFSATKEGPLLCLEELINKEDRMRDVHQEIFNSQPLPIGINPMFTTNEDYSRFLPDRKRAQIVTPSILERMKPEDMVFTDEKTGEKINFGKVPGGGFMNSLHISISGTNDRHSVLLYNIANALSGPLIALAANSCAMDKKLTTCEDTHLFVYENNKDIVNGVPRVGNVPKYLNSLDNYFRAMLEFDPIFNFDEKEPLGSLHNHFSSTWPWVKAQVNGFYRVEFRPMPKQPTLIEDMAVSSLFLYSALALEEEMGEIINTKENIGDYCNKNLFPSDYLIKNSHEAAEKGFDAKLAWKDKFVPAQDILKELYTKATQYMKKHNIGQNSYEIVKTNQPRIENRINPSRKFRQEVKKYGFENALDRYHDHTINKRDKPYVG
ncbi:MAG: hypothetical protein ACOCZ6_06055 [Nanoarchaeota archaeon]